MTTALYGVVAAQNRRAREREERVAELWAMGAREVRDIAAAVRTTERTVQRILLRLRLRTPRAESERVDYARLARLAEEGMPANWIAEDLGVNYRAVQEHTRHVPGREEAKREWASAWQSIRQNEALLALHHEIAPTVLVRIAQVASPKALDAA